MPNDIEVALLWRNDYEPARVFNQRLDVEAGRDPALSRSPATGTGTEPSPGSRSDSRARINSRSWCWERPQRRRAPAKCSPTGCANGSPSKPWNGSSINTIIGGADVQALPMPFVFAVIVGLAALMYVGLARWRPRMGGPSHCRGHRRDVRRGLVPGRHAPAVESVSPGVGHGPSIRGLVVAERHLAAEDSDGLRVHRESARQIAAATHPRVHGWRRTLLSQSRRVPPLPVQRFFRTVREYDAAAVRVSQRRLPGRVPAPGPAIRRGATKPALGCQSACCRRTGVRRGRAPRCSRFSDGRAGAPVCARPCRGCSASRCCKRSTGRAMERRGVATALRVGFGYVVGAVAVDSVDARAESSWVSSSVAPRSHCRPLALAAALLAYAVRVRRRPITGCHRSIPETGSPRTQSGGSAWCGRCC